MQVNPTPFFRRQYFYDKDGNKSSGYKVGATDILEMSEIEGGGITMNPGFGLKKPDPTFEDDCLAGKDLPIMCDKCANADVKLNKCKFFKIDKRKFHQLQDNDFCVKFEKIA